MGEPGGLPQRGHDRLFQLADQVRDDRIRNVRRAGIDGFLGVCAPVPGGPVQYA